MLSLQDEDSPRPKKQMMKKKTKKRGKNCDPIEKKNNLTLHNYPNPNVFEIRPVLKQPSILFCSFQEIQVGQKSIQDVLLKVFTSLFLNLSCDFDIPLNKPVPAIIVSNSCPAKTYSLKNKLLVWQYYCKFSGSETRMNHMLNLLTSWFNKANSWPN